MLDAILSSMMSRPAIGIVFPDDPHVLSWTGNRRHAEELADRMGCGKLPEHFNFPVGSMFWGRSSFSGRFVALDLQWSDYPLEPLPVDGTMLHAIERLFGIVPADYGDGLAVTNVRGSRGDFGGRCATSSSSNVRGQGRQRRRRGSLTLMPRSAKNLKEVARLADGPSVAERENIRLSRPRATGMGQAEHGSRQALRGDQHARRLNRSLR